jgi:outer membrane lipoprotein-sorting protein
MGKGIALLAAALALAPGALRAETADRLVTRIDSLYHAAPYWRVEFIETVRYPVFDEVETDQGSILVGPQGRFVLKTKRHVVVSDGDTLWTHNVQANQVTVERVDRAGEVVRPADFLFHFRSHYAAALSDSAGPGSCLALTATDETAFIRTMWLWVDPGSATVHKARYLDVNQNETTFDFAKIDFKVRPKADRFHYSPPAGVEIVRMPGR